MSGAESPHALIESAINRIARKQIIRAQMASMVHALWTVGGDTNRRDYPSRHKPTDQETTRRELTVLAKAADKLCDVIGSLHAPAHDAIHNLDEISAQLRILAIVAKFQADSEHDVEYQKRIYDEYPSPQEELAFNAACVFAQATGLAPALSSKDQKVNKTVSGQATGGLYVSFLTEVFAIRDMDASPASCAKAAVERWKLIAEKQD